MTVTVLFDDCLFPLTLRKNYGFFYKNLREKKLAASGNQLTARLTMNKLFHLNFDPAANRQSAIQPLLIQPLGIADAEADAAVAVWLLA